MVLVSSSPIHMYTIYLRIHLWGICTHMGKGGVANILLFMSIYSHRIHDWTGLLRVVLRRHPLDLIFLFSPPLQRFDLCRHVHGLPFGWGKVLTPRSSFNEYLEARFFWTNASSIANMTWFLQRKL